MPAVPSKVNDVGRLDEEIEICVTPSQYFKAKFRGIFTRMKIQHSSGTGSNTWLARPNMSYWSQQLNFAVWCARTGCGISREVFDKNCRTDQVVSDVSYILHGQKDSL